MTKDGDIEDWRAHARANRIHESIMKRLYSFITIYAVVTASVLLVIVAFKWHQSPCQVHVNEPELVIFAHSSTPEDVLKHGIDIGLKDLGLSLQQTDRKDDPLSNWTESFYDTPNGILRGSALQVRKRSWPDKPFIEYSVRYLSNDICLDHPPFDLTTEKIGSDFSKKRMSAVSDGYQTSFVRQKSIYSKISSRVATVGDMEATFPFLRQMVNFPSSKSLEFNQYEVHPLFLEPIYSNISHSLLKSDIALERWVSRDEVKDGFLLIRLHIGSFIEESFMRKVHESIKQQIDGKQLCSNFCGFPLSYL